MTKKTPSGMKHLPEGVFHFCLFVPISCGGAVVIAGEAAVEAADRGVTRSCGDFFDGNVFTHQ